MLSETERHQIEEEIAKVDRREGASIEALKIVQQRRGWVDDEALRDAAEFLGMTADELDAVATFYNLIFRRTVGRHVILICDSVSCYVLGYEQMLNHFKERLGITLGETTPDNRFTLLPVACLGICDHAPAMMIDQDLHVDLTEAKIDEILQRYP